MVTPQRHRRCSWFLMEGVALTLLLSVACADPPRDDAEAFRQLTILASDGMAGPTSCPEAAGAGSGRSDTLVIIDELNAFPCRVAARPAIRLSPSFEGQWPDPSWYSVVRDSRGRIYTTPADMSVGMILVWDSTGSFLRGAGRPGEGPRELSTSGASSLFLGPADTLFVAQAGRWDTFGPDLEFGRRLGGLRLTTTGPSRAMMSGGEIAAYGLVRQTDSLAAIHIVGRDGSWLRSFGDLRQHARGRTRDARRGFPVAPTDQRTLWTARAATTDESYVLEEWDVEGRRLRAIERKAPWFQPQPEDDPNPLRMPMVQALHVDERGLVWLTFVVKDSRWEPVEPDASPEVARLFDARFEVIDPDAGRVLASGRIDDLGGSGAPGEDAPLLTRFISRSNLT